MSSSRRPTDRDENTAAQDRVVMTTHKVVIDANDHDHAADLYERLRNDGYRVKWERHYLIEGGDGKLRITEHTVDD